MKQNITDKYKKEIREGNPDFFIKKDYKKDIAGQEGATKILKAIEQLREPINKMGEEKQEESDKIY